MPYRTSYDLIGTPDTYILEEKDCTVKTQKKYETVMCLGNGYLGMRSAFSEVAPSQSRLTMIAGLYDQQPNEVEELMPLPDATALHLAADGTTLSPMSADVRDYGRSLNLKNGLLSYTYTQNLANGGAVTVTQRRFVSMAQRHLVAFDTTIVADCDTELSVNVSINARQTMNGTQHAFEDERTVLADDVLWYAGHAAVAGTPFRIANRVKFYVNGEEMSKQRYSTDRRYLATNAKISLHKGDEVRISRLVLFYTGHDTEMKRLSLDGSKEMVTAEMARLAAKGFEALLDESRAAWAARWSNCDVTVNGKDPTETLNIRLCLYHSIIMCPDHDDRLSIAAKGLTGPGYAGHVFWDCEIFNLPFFVYTDPATARKLCTYRYRTLGGARKKAKEYGYQGAMFPWEGSSCKGEEQCPTYGGYDADNVRHHINCGEIEHHIVCDVAYGSYQYATITRDRAFLRKYGYEILFETANFWQSRMTFNKALDRYEILDLTGPDEYKEHVDNNAYTNYMVKWNLDTALSEAEKLQAEDKALFDRLDQKIGLVALMEQIRQKAPKLYLPVPNEEGLIPQDDTYLTLEKIDLTKYKTSGINRLIFKDYNSRERNHIMVSKQADIVQLFVLLPGLFSPETVKQNFDFYESRCLHDSSLSLSAYAMVAASLGMPDFAHQFFHGALNTDFGENKISCSEGIHAANCGGVWQSVVFGFAGVKATEKSLTVDPHLPSCWNEISFRLYYHGCHLKVTVSKDSVTLEPLNGKKFTCSVHGKTVTASKTVTVNY